MKKEITIILVVLTLLSFVSSSYASWWNESTGGTNTNCTVNWWADYDDGSSTVGYDTSGGIRLGFPYENNLKAFWSFDNVIKDEMCVNDGSGTPSYVNGVVNQALNMTQDITISDDPSISGLAEISIEFWLKPTLDNTVRNIINKGCTFSEYCIRLQADNSLYVGLLTTQPKSPGITSTASLINNSWNHIVVTYAVGGGSIWMNGVNVTINSCSGDCSNPLTDASYSLIVDSSVIGAIDRSEEHTSELQSH